MTIAAESYRELSPEMKTNATEILKSHPDYSKWQKSFTTSSNSMDMELYVFMRASTWPDEIRRRENPYDHPHWHYIDYPLRPPDFKFEEPVTNRDDNVVVAIADCEQKLSNTNLSTLARAVSLSWLIHLVGDLHQPLHCCSYFSADYPNGDKGGNDFFVAPAGQGIRLHSLWDGLLGNRTDMKAHVQEAIRLPKEHPRKDFPELKDPSVRQWSLEGRNLAAEKAYLNGNLKGSKTAEAAPPLPEGYTKTAKAVAERQGALAGYRLADEIQQFLK
jgi:hypothetical protein